MKKRQLRLLFISAFEGSLILAVQPTSSVYNKREKWKLSLFQESFLINFQVSLLCLRLMGYITTLE